MRLLFIRHGDPDYVNDSLTETGAREAASLAGHIAEWNIDDIYLSPLGRARETARYSINALGLDFDEISKKYTKDWLMEFNAVVDVPAMPHYLEAYPNSVLPDGSLRKRICWDMVPAYLNRHPEYLETWGWRDTELIRDTDVAEQFDWVCNGLDILLAEYGYVRDGMGYRVEKECDKTIAFFCHFGVSCVMLSHLINASPFSLWHGLCLAPTSVTDIYTEERQQGYASFRAWKTGDVSHLIRDGIEPSFSARFAEVYSNTEQRH